MCSCMVFEILAGYVFKSKFLAFVFSLLRGIDADSDVVANPESFRLSFGEAEVGILPDSDAIHPTMNATIPHPSL